jgi:anhydro-N-acetylmuramic acid kinase
LKLAAEVSERSASTTMARCVGLMSGTSLDGVDGVVLNIGTSRLEVQAHVHQAFDPSLREALRALQARGDDELHRMALASNAVALAYAHVVRLLLQKAGLKSADIQAIGAHGQTVRHQPLLHDGLGYTSQLLNGAVLAQRTGIDVVCDFRSMDVADGGQGAPLVPAFHQAAFGQRRAVAVVNIGGMANVSLLEAGREPRGFDTGPGGALLDGWCERHWGVPFDRDGSFAASGVVRNDLLNHLLQDPYFQKPPPKSTGRDTFDMHWLDAAMRSVHGSIAQTPTPSQANQPQDVQATLAELTAITVADAISSHAPTTQQVVVCGGGAHNTHLMKRLHAALAQRIAGVGFETSDALGLPVDQVEAAAFAWLAHRRVTRQGGNVPGVTGASTTRILGAWHAAH